MDNSFLQRGVLLDIKTIISLNIETIETWVAWIRYFPYPWIIVLYCTVLLDAGNKPMKISQLPQLALKMQNSHSQSYTSNSEQLLSIPLLYLYWIREIKLLFVLCLFHIVIDALFLLIPVEYVVNWHTTLLALAPRLAHPTREHFDIDNFKKS